MTSSIMASTVRSVGFDDLASILSAEFFSTAPTKKLTALGVANNAHRSLKVTFAEPLNATKTGKRTTAPPAPTNRRSVVSPRPPHSVFAPSPSAQTTINATSNATSLAAFATPSPAVAMHRFPRLQCVDMRRSLRVASASATQAESNISGGLQFDHPEAITVPLSTTNNGLRRLKYGELLRLKRFDRFTLVLPAIDRRVGSNSKQ